jgi:hypothetical protein
VSTEEREALIEVLSKVPVVELARSRVLTQLLLAALADRCESRRCVKPSMRSAPEVSTYRLTISIVV